MFSDELRKQSGKLTFPEDGDGLSDQLLMSALGELETPSLAKQEANLVLFTGSPGYFIISIIFQYFDPLYLLDLIFLFNYSQLPEQCYF